MAKGGYKVKFDGLESYIDKLEKAGKSANGLAKRALYDGAAVMADALRDATESLPTQEDRYVPEPFPIGDITDAQKEGLLNGIGITTMKEDGKSNITVKVGFDGYNSVRTVKYPNGQPNRLIANAINSGTSRRPKRNFVGNAKKAKKNAEAAMIARFDEDTKQIFKE